MQLVFTIHVIITLLMLKPATSMTCGNTILNDNYWSFCPQNNMYLTELPISDLSTAGKCCEAVEPSYANQPTTCLQWPRYGYR